MGEVPFFLYNPASFSLYSDCDRTTFGNTKHSAALYFIERIRTSKWRTLHMGEAKLAVVPVLLDWFAHGLCSGNASDHVKNTTALVGKHVDAAARGDRRELCLVGDRAQAAGRAPESARRHVRRGGLVAGLDAARERLCDGPLWLPRRLPDVPRHLFGQGAVERGAHGQRVSRPRARGHRD